MQAHLGEVIRCRSGNTRYWMSLTLVRSGIRQIGFGVRKYCGSDEPRIPNLTNGLHNRPFSEPKWYVQSDLQPPRDTYRVMLMLEVFVKNARITSKWHYLVKKNRRDSNFFSNCLLKSTLYDGLYIFEKKLRRSR